MHTHQVQGVDVSSYHRARHPSEETSEMTFEEEVPHNYVKYNAQVWNDMIGDWTFNGLQPTASATHKYRVTKEIKVPMPLGSTENLLGSSGR